MSDLSVKILILGDFSGCYEFMYVDIIVEIQGAAGGLIGFSKLDKYGIIPHGVPVAQRIEH